ncbi:hypothetical protein A2U01_0062454, partial [Trifolium medium]|nr:hypothetical protein [Trifolium medium]
SLKNLGQRGTQGAIVLDGPRLWKEAEALRGQGHLVEEMRGVLARGETRLHLETHHVARIGTYDILRGDAPLGGTLHLLDTTDDALWSRKNATRGLYHGESWISNCPQDWRSHMQWIS